MEIHLILGYLGAILIGVVLGLIGGGGSILTLPVLVYLFGIEPVIATAYSLFIVGVAAVAGTLKNMSQKLVDFKTALIFALPAFIAVYLTRRYLVPSLPDPLLSLGDFSLTKDVGIMVFFALIMVLASVSMIRDRRKEADTNSENNEPQYNCPNCSRRVCRWGAYWYCRGRWWVFNYPRISSSGKIADEKSGSDLFTDYCHQITYWFYWGHSSH